MCCLRVTLLVYLTTIAIITTSERIPRGMFGFDSLPTIAPLFIRVRATTSAPGRLQSAFLGMVNRVGNMISGLGNRSASNETQQQQQQGGFLSRIVSRIFSGFTSNSSVPAEPRQVMDVNNVDSELSHTDLEQQSPAHENTEH